MIYLGGRSNLTKLDETLTMLKELTDAKGIPGNEREPRDVMKKYITPFSDNIEQDGLGSLIASKTGDENGPKIMVTGHLDEVGFMVSKIDDKGFLPSKRLEAGGRKLCLHNASQSLLAAEKL